MTRRLTALIGVLVIAAGSTAVAGAAAKHRATKHRFNIVAQLHATKTDTQGVLEFKGSVTGTQGRGTAVSHNKLLSATSSTATAVVSYRKGTVSSFYAVTQRATADGFAFTGTGHITGGTGIFRHARGSNLKLAGTAGKTLQTATFRITGTITY